MALPTLAISKQYDDGRALTEAQLDAAFASVTAWAGSLVSVIPEISGTVAITGTWSFTSLTLTNNLITRSDGDQWAIPDSASSETFVGLSATQTITNKTLISPVITGGTISSPTITGGSITSSTITTPTITTPTITTPSISDPTLSGTITLPATNPPVANTLTQGGVVKAWGMISWSAGTPSITASYNLASITDTGPGDVKLTWSTAFANNNYALIAMPLDTSSADPLVAGYVTKITTDCNVRFRTRAAGTLTDPTSMVFIACGDQ